MSVAHTLVLGGARSGKSAYAEGLVEAMGPERLYLATGSAGDTEMASRIAAHQARRGEGWRTVEEQVAVCDVIRGADTPVLFDCLTLWLNNLMFFERDIDAEMCALITALAEAPQPVVMVSNEVGMGLVPETPLGRAFRDAQGTLNQRIAEASDRVVFVAAGLPLELKA